MDKERLTELIEGKFPTKRAFIDEFNKQGGDLDETVLSSQLSGKRGLSKAWIAAYRIFFNLIDRQYQSKISSMNDELLKNPDKYQWAYNHQIHEDAKMDIQTFLHQVRNVKALRVGQYRNFSFYPTTKRDYEESIALWNFANDKRNELNSYHYIFAVAIPKPLYHFFRHTKRSQIFRPVILGLATLYVLEPDMREIMREQVYPTIYEKVLPVAEKYFKKILDNEPSEEERENDRGYYHRRHQLYNDLLDKAIRAYIGNTTLLPYLNAQKNIERYKLAMKEKREFDIRCLYAYMTKNDWTDIIVNDDFEDDLMRAESNEEVFSNWKFDLIRFHKGVPAF